MFLLVDVSMDHEPRRRDAGDRQAIPGLIANDQVDFDLRRGEIHALLGENGAGKSHAHEHPRGPLPAGRRHHPVDGRAGALRSPADAIAAGLGMVHQHFTLVPSLTVTENILLGLQEPRFRLSLGSWHARIRAFSDEMGLHVDADAFVWQLNVGEQQRVEILKMLYRGAHTADHGRAHRGARAPARPTSCSGR